MNIFQGTKRPIFEAHRSDRTEQGRTTPYVPNMTTHVHVSKDSSVKQADTSTPLTFINLASPSAIRDPANVRLARTHAITVALERQRSRLRRTGGHFREHIIGPDGKSRQAKSERASKDKSLDLLKLSSSLGAGSLDPFETLLVNAKRLTALLHLRSSLCAGEPVFSVNDVIHYQGLHSVFERGLDDGALAAALSMTFAFAANGWTLNGECLYYRSKVIDQLRHSIADHNTAVSTVTVGTILLLLGIEYRLGDRASAQVHLNGVQVVLQLCHQRRVTLPSALRRALYWQDLFSALIVGTPRSVAYGIYPITYQSSDFALDIGHVPIGFATRIDLLGIEFLRIAADVHVLYQKRLDFSTSAENSQVLEKIDSLQAWIEGRLWDLRNTTSDPVLISCITALFLCTYGFWDAIWNAAMIPRVLTTQLLHYLGLCTDWAHWEAHSDLFLWIIRVGEAFAIDPNVRIGFQELCKCKDLDILIPAQRPWHATEQILNNFIWSDTFYEPDRGAFWERIGKYQP